jgi:outer membrane protein TolC
LVGVNLNVPIYRKRLDAAVREAEAQVVVRARQYDALRRHVVTPFSIA